MQALGNLSKRAKRLAFTVSMAITVLALGVMPAFATTPTDPAATAVMDAAETVLTDNVPVIIGSLAVLITLGLGITVIWTAVANAKKGIRQAK